MTPLDAVAILNSPKDSERKLWFTGGKEALCLRIATQWRELVPGNVSPSVSSEWPEDPYRAPEVDGGSATVQADLYSFGKTAVAATAGELVGHDIVPDIFSKVGIPKRLAKLLIDCTEPVPAERPADLTLLLKERAAWQKKTTR